MMNNKFLKKILKMVGINDAVFYFLLGKVFSFAATPITLYLIASYLSPAEQGYYYTFLSLLALSIFFELGLGVVITQFASHEYAHLLWTKNNSLDGNDIAVSRLISLLRKSLKWYAAIITLFILILLPAGLLFFGLKPDSSSIKYSFPWIIMICFFGLSTCSIPLTSVIEGCGRIAQVQKLRLMQVIAGAICVCIVILAGGKLFAAPAGFIASWCVIVLWLVYNYKGLLNQILNHNLISNAQISWWREIFPMQWRIAISWMAAYFSNYLFVPLSFVYRGSVEAGKMGMSLTLTGMIFTISMAWVNTRVPLFGALIKKKKYKELDKMASKSSLQAFLVGFALSIIIIFCAVLLKNYFPKYNDRILSIYAISSLCLANLANVVMTSMAGYLRAHKKEPLMVNSVILALLVASSCFLSAKYLNTEMIVVSFAAIFLFIGIPSVTYIFLKKRKKWHQLRKNVFTNL